MKSTDKNEEMMDKLYSDLFGGFTRNILKEAQLPKDALGLSNKDVNELYTKAYHLYNTGKYSEAIHLFRVLVMGDQSEPKYIMGMAACNHLMKEYKEASRGYTLASLLDPDNPIPYYHLADCSIHLKDPFAAMIFLEMTIKRAGKKEEYKAIKERSILALEGLKNQNSEK